MSPGQEPPRLDRNLGTVIIFLLLCFFAWLSGQSRTRTLEREDYTQLGARDFETHVRDVFRALPGWTADVTKGSHDMGLDVLAVSPEGVRWAVQVKHYLSRNTPGIDAVQEAHFARAFHDCQRALVVISTPHFTSPACRGARKVGVKLWTGDDLRRLQRSAAQQAPLPRDLFSA